MHNLRKAVFMFAFGSLAACNSPPTPAELAAADYGPFPDNFEEIIQGYFDRSLKDPSSLQIQGTIPVPIGSYLKFGGRLSVGYKTCVTYNAKNSFGAYIGYNTDYFLIRYGIVAEHIEKADRVGAAFGAELC